MTDIFDDQRDFSSLDREAYEWVRRFEAGTAGQADLAALKRWSVQSSAHQEAFDRVSRAWKRLGPVGRELAAEEPALSGRQVAERRPTRIGRRAFLGGAFAAAATGAAVIVVRPPFGLWPSWSELTADYHTGTGEQRRITLANSTVAVEMNTRTSIAVGSTGAGTGRIELIAGEAMFSATPKAAESVMVLAADGRITTRDARFNVRLDGRSICVTCLEGEVQVERHAMALSLPAGRQVTYSDTGIGRTAEADPAMVTAWRDGLVIFRSTPIADVVSEINRYRPGRVILTNAALGRRRFNARFRLADIDQVVRQIEQVFGARVTMLPGGIVLLG